jgi:hypothetical protein
MHTGLIETCQQLFIASDNREHFFQLVNRRETKGGIMHAYEKFFAVVLAEGLTSSYRDIFTRHLAQHLYQDASLTL